MSHGDMGPALKMLPSPTICMHWSSDTTAPKSRQMGDAAFHAVLNAASVAVALALLPVMPYALGCAR